MVRQYSDEFKRSMVKKIGAPGGWSAATLAQEVGVSQSSLSRWIRKYATVDLGGTMNSRRPQDWNIRERLEAIIAFENLSEEDRGEFLCKRGLHEANLEQWKTELVEQAEEGGKKKRGGSGEQKRIRELEKELRRKEKALAETAALLVLKKKANAIWGDRGDDE